MFPHFLLSPRRIYAATSSGLSISSNGGALFTTATGLPSCLVTSLSRDGNLLYVASGNKYGGGLSLSADGGTTFQNLTVYGQGITFVHVVGGEIYAASRYNGGFRSSDAGNSFTRFTTTKSIGPSDGYPNEALSVYSDGSRVFVASYGIGVAYSSDGGESFVNRTTSDGLGSNTSRDVYALGNDVYVATDGGVSISNNGGQSFSNRTSAGHGLGADNVSGVFAVGNNVYAATGAGVSVSTNGGGSFVNSTLAQGLASNVVSGIYVSVPL